MINTQPAGLKSATSRNLTSKTKKITECTAYKEEHTIVTTLLAEEIGPFPLPLLPGSNKA